jgi:hypothetical protein
LKHHSEYFRPQLKTYLIGLGSSIWSITPT